jgi:hypothetical protein
MGGRLRQVRVGDARSRGVVATGATGASADLCWRDSIFNLGKRLASADAQPCRRHHHDEHLVAACPAPIRAVARAVRRTVSYAGIKLAETQFDLGR